MNSLEVEANVHDELRTEDAEIARLLTLELRKIVDVEYIADQIFNVDETSFYWKRMRTRTYILKTQKSVPGFKKMLEMATGNVDVTAFFCFLSAHAHIPNALFGVLCYAITIV
ncbi:hypothetical protein NPIL_466331, partial [Nephila pilipes]